MKRILFIILLCITSISCQDVIDVPLETAPKKLVIDARILWLKDDTDLENASGKNQTIRLSTTTDYYSQTIPGAKGANVTVTNSKNEVFNFIETATDGNYDCDKFKPEINEKYKLKVVYENQIYEAEETLIATPKVTKVTQTLEPFFNNDIFEIKFFFQDPPNENNYYLSAVSDPNQKLPFFQTLDDQFTQGNETFSIYREDKLKKGDQLVFGLEGISSRNINYLDKLLTIAGGQGGGGGPFSTPPAIVRGNIVNVTNKDNYALGYFSLGQLSVKVYTVE
jgi:hypothetical protein